MPSINDLAVAYFGGPSDTLGLNDLMSLFLQTGLRSVEVTLTPVDLTTAPFYDPTSTGPGLVVIPAPGEGRVIIVQPFYYSTVSDGTEWGQSADPTLAWGDASGNNIFAPMTDQLGATSTTDSTRELWNDDNYTRISSGGLTIPPAIENQPVVLSTSNDLLGSGAGTRSVTYKIFYQIFNTLPSSASTFFTITGVDAPIPRTNTTFTVTVNATSGDFTLNIEDLEQVIDNTSDPIPFDASASAVKAIIDASLLFDTASIVTGSLATGLTIEIVSMNSGNASGKLRLIPSVDTNSTDGSVVLVDLTVRKEAFVVADPTAALDGATGSLSAVGTPSNNGDYTIEQATWYIDSSRSIDSFNPSRSSVTIVGDLVADYGIGLPISITGSISADGDYTVLSSGLVSGDTEIRFFEPILNATGGTIEVTAASSVVFVTETIPDTTPGGWIEVE